MLHDYHYGYKNILLRPLRESDIEPLRVLRNKNRIYFNSATDISSEEQKIWYENYLNKSDDIMFAVTTVEDPKGFMGTIAVYNIDVDNQIAEIGRTLIDKKIAFNKGVGADATRTICLFAFDELHLNTLYATILKNNERIIKIDTKVGFYITGSIDELSYKIEMTRNSLRL